MAPHAVNAEIFGEMNMSVTCRVIPIWSRSLPAGVQKRTRAIESRTPTQMRSYRTLPCQVFQQVIDNETFPQNSLGIRALQDGGEGGIRTRQDPLDSVNYRF